MNLKGFQLCMKVNTQSNQFVQQSIKNNSIVFLINTKILYQTYQNFQTILNILYIYIFSHANCQSNIQLHGNHLTKLQADQNVLTATKYFYDTTVTQGSNNLNENKLNVAIKQTRIQINWSEEKRYTLRAPNT